ncbi:MAG: aminofutalosine synthase MqnE, partial [Proteobacteria bacterium]|nr:aminofutalosine synthase MqnE [Pseudomonadota bacterium]
MASAHLDSILQKAVSGKRLSRDEGLALLKSSELLSLGKAAHAMKLQKTGQQVFFNVNCHINLTNICVSRCKFCAFSCGKEDARAYAMTVEDVMERARAALPTGITEFHIVSGL